MSLILVKLMDSISETILFLLSTVLICFCPIVRYILNLGSSRKEHYLSTLSFITRDFHIILFTLHLLYL